MNSENINQHSKHRGEISLQELLVLVKEWFNYLISNWKLILLFGILGASIGVFYAYRKEVIYTATTTFVLEDPSSSTGGGLSQFAGLASMAGIDVGGAAGGTIFQGDNIIELYKSRKMIEKTLLTTVKHDGKSEMLINMYISINHLKDKDGKPLNVAFKQYNFLGDSINPPKRDRYQDSIISNIVMDINKKYLSVSKLDKKLSIIKSEIKANDEFFAKAFNDEIVKNVNDFYVKTKTKKSHETVVMLQQKVDSVRSVMNGAIYNSVRVADQTPNLNPTRQVQRIVPMQKSQFLVETNKSMLGELLKNLEIAKMSYVKETPLIEVIDFPVFPLEKSRLSKLIALIIGGFSFGFIIVGFLTLKWIIKSSFNK